MSKCKGAVCPKHPELEGLRYISGHNCVGCKNDSATRQYEALKRLPDLEAEVARLRAQIAARAGKRIGVREMSNEYLMVPRDAVKDLVELSVRDRKFGARRDEVRKLLADDAAPYSIVEPVAWIVSFAECGSLYTITRDKERGEKLSGDPEFVSTPLYARAEHQGEPVALPERKTVAAGLLSESNTHNRGWNACLDEIAKLGPLYTHADPVEVERLRAEVAKFRGYCVDLDSEKRELEHKMDAYKGAAEEVVTLRAHLAERDALIESAYSDGWNDGQEAIEQRYQVTPRTITEGWQRFKAYSGLSASAEPSAPKSSLPGVRYIDNHSWPLPHLRADNCIFKGKNADGSDPFRFEVCADGSRRLVMVNMVGWVCSGPMQDEPSAPVERDERAAFEKAATALHANVTMGPMGTAYFYVETEAMWKAWQARAALERKP